MQCKRCGGYAEGYSGFCLECQQAIVDQQYALSTSEVRTAQQKLAAIIVAALCILSLAVGLGFYFKFDLNNLSEFLAKMGFPRDKGSYSAAPAPAHSTARQERIAKEIQRAKKHKAKWSRKRSQDKRKKSWVDQSRYWGEYKGNHLIVPTRRSLSDPNVPDRAKRKAKRVREDFKRRYGYYPP